MGGGYLIYLDRPTLRKLSRWICFVLQSTAKSNFALFCLRGVSRTMSTQYVMDVELRRDWNR